MARTTKTNRGQLSTTFQLAIFKTPLGWFGMLGHGGKLQKIQIGQPSKKAVEEAFREEYEDATFELTSWNPNLENRLCRFARGEVVSFADVELEWPKPLTDFRRRVIEQARGLAWGETATYGELAQRAGSPRAARAVGSTMATNLFPIVIPCHRVVGCNGGLGGFSAPSGVSLKRQLLTMEADSQA
jgi:methylated-DNA-[protein]-cysteine S-methyltransferase